MYKKKTDMKKKPTRQQPTKTDNINNLKHLFYLF